MEIRKNSAKKRWKDIDWREAEKFVHRLQCKIFDAAQNKDTCATSKIQNQLVKSFYARAIAVRQTAKKSKGRKSPGPDGICNPSEAVMLSMIDSLEIGHRPSPVKRTFIPKPGKKDKRPLGIPNLIDRAHQSLLVMALEPQWETRLPDSMFGFRKGRGTKDAIAYLQNCLRKSPRWVLDADIEKFFDNINKKQLLDKIDAPDHIRQAVRRVLKAGAISEGVVQFNTKGTPQGGPLSPLLANIALAGLPEHIFRAYRKQVGNKTILPKVVLYADDMVITHPERHIVDACREWVNQYLAGLGLKLNAEKTRTCHTTKSCEPPGFDFLGVHFQHHTKKTTGGTKRPYLLAKPSKASISRIAAECKVLIKGCKVMKKHASKRRHQQASKKRDPVTRTIDKVNRALKGWGNYHKSFNSKVAFVDVDHRLHWILWRWARKQFKGRTVDWILRNIFSGVEADQKGMPLLRQDGNPRERRNIFRSPFVKPKGPHVTVCKLSDTPIRTHTMVKMTKSYFDNDWTYWCARSSKRYPGRPANINVKALKRQGGKCSICREPFNPSDHLEVTTEGKDKMLVHRSCPKNRVATHPGDECCA